MNPNCLPSFFIFMPYERLPYTHLPFGIVVLGDVSQMKLYEIYWYLPGVLSIADDVMIHGKSHIEHGECFQCFLEITRKKESS